MDKYQTVNNYTLCTYVIVEIADYFKYMKRKFYFVQFILKLVGFSQFQHCFEVQSDKQFSRYFYFGSFQKTFMNDHPTLRILSLLSDHHQMLHPLKKYILLQSFLFFNQKKHVYVSVLEKCFLCFISKNVSFFFVLLVVFFSREGGGKLYKSLIVV